MLTYKALLSLSIASLTIVIRQVLRKKPHKTEYKTTSFKYNLVIMIFNRIYSSLFKTGISGFSLFLE